MTAHAIDRTSTQSGDWNVGATWGGTAPVNDLTTDTANIASGHTVTLTAATQIGTLRFTTGASRTLSAATLTTLTAGGASAATWNSGSGGTITFDRVDLTVNNNSQIITMAGSGARTISLDNGSAISIDDGTYIATMSGAVGSMKTIQSTGGGSFTVGPSGVLALGATGVVGNYMRFTAPVTFSLESGGAMQLGVSGGYDIASDAATLAGSVAFTTSGSGDLRYSGSGTLTIGTQLTVSNDNGGGTDTFDVRSGTLSFGGTTSLDLGSQVLTISGGTVSGTASLATSVGSINVAAGVSAVNIQPAGAGPRGHLNLNTLDISFAGTGNTKTLTLDITSNADRDRLTVGDVTGIGNLSLAVNNTSGIGSYTLNTPITVISAASGLGNFANVADGATITSGGVDFTVDITATEVTLTPVPEPEHYLGAVALGLVGFAAFRRSQIRKA